MQRYDLFSLNDAPTETSADDDAAAGAPFRPTIRADDESPRNATAIEFEAQSGSSSTLSENQQRNPPHNTERSIQELLQQLKEWRQIRRSASDHSPPNAPVSAAEAPNTSLQGDPARKSLLSAEGGSTPSLGSPPKRKIPEALAAAASAEEILVHKQKERRRITSALESEMPAFPAGAFPAGAFPASAFPTGAFPTGAFPTGAFPTGAFPTGAFPAGASPAGDFPAGDFPTGAFPTGAFPAGAFPAGAFPASAPLPGESGSLSNSPTQTTFRLNEQQPMEEQPPEFMPQAGPAQQEGSTRRGGGMSTTARGSPGVMLFGCNIAVSSAVAGTSSGALITSESHAAIGAATPKTQTHSDLQRNTTAGKAEGSPYADWTHSGGLFTSSSPSARACTSAGAAVSLPGDRTQQLPASNSYPGAAKAKDSSYAGAATANDTLNAGAARARIVPQRHAGGGGSGGGLDPRTTAGVLADIHLRFTSAARTADAHPGFPSAARTAGIDGLGSASAPWDSLLTFNVPAAAAPAASAPDTGPAPAPVAAPVAAPASVAAPVAASAGFSTAAAAAVVNPSRPGGIDPALLAYVRRMLLERSVKEAAGVPTTMEDLRHTEDSRRNQSRETPPSNPPTSPPNPQLAAAGWNPQGRSQGGARSAICPPTSSPPIFPPRSPTVFPPRSPPRSPPIGAQLHSVVEALQEAPPPDLRAPTAAAAAAAAATAAASVASQSAGARFPSGCPYYGPGFVALSAAGAASAPPPPLATASTPAGASAELSFRRQGASSAAGEEEILNLATDPRLDPPAEIPQAAEPASGNAAPMAGGVTASARRSSPTPRRTAGGGRGGARTTTGAATGAVASPRDGGTPETRTAGNARAADEVSRRRFRCMVCDRRFSSGQALGGHSRMHAMQLRATGEIAERSLAAPRHEAAGREEGNDAN